MNFDKFTDRSRGFIQSAQGFASRANHQQLLPEHLLKVLIEDQGARQHGLLAPEGATRSPFARWFKKNWTDCQPWKEVEQDRSICLVV